jgi:hypothetical protein
MDILVPGFLKWSNVLSPVGGVPAPAHACARGAPEDMVARAYARALSETRARTQARREGRGAAHLARFQRVAATNGALDAEHSASGIGDATGSCNSAQPCNMRS